jgi:hypothetical protein
MFFENINYWTIVISAVVSMALGFVWYSQWLFGKKFMKEMNMTPEKIEEMNKGENRPNMAKTYVIMTVMSLITAFVVAGLLNSLIITSLGSLVLFGVLIWLAFNMPVAANHVMFGNDSFALFLINTGYQLVSIVLTALMIGIWG